MAQMEFIHRDVDENLIKYIEREALSDNTAFFYLTRRHWLEIMPEVLTSGFMLITWIAIAYNFGWLIDGLMWRALVGGWGLVIIVAFPFGLEIFRWQREIYFLADSGFYHSQFSLRSLNQVSEQIGWVASARAVRFGYYKLLGIDVGYFVARGVDGRHVYSPLLPRPFVLQRRFSEIRNYQPKGE